MWGIQGKSIEEKLNQGVRDVANRHVAFSTYYWGANDCHYDNLRHRHSFFEVCYVVDGTGSYHEENAVIPLVPGTLFLSKPGVVHQIRSETGLGIVFTAFDLDASRSLPAWSDQYSHLAATSAILSAHCDDAQVLPVVWKTLCLAIQASSQLETIHGLALALLTSIPQAFGVPHTPVSQGSSSNPLVDRATKFIHDNILHTLPLGAVASYLRVSERHLSKVLKLATGMSYNAWVTHQRILTARHLLSHTDLPIKAVAEQAGFSSVHYFTNVFRQQCQLTPAKYRAHHGHYTAAGSKVETVFER